MRTCNLISRADSVREALRLYRDARETVRKCREAEDDFGTLAFEGQKEAFRWMVMVLMALPAADTDVGGKDNGIVGDIDDAVHRLAAIEDILGYDYDLDRLRELVEADREGRCAGCSVPETTAEMIRDLNDAPKLRAENEALRRALLLPRYAGGDGGSGWK